MQDASTAVVDPSPEVDAQILAPVRLSKKDDKQGGMRAQFVGFAVAACAVAISTASDARPAKVDASVPWCAAEVSDLEEHACYFEGAPRADGRRTLVIYLHGMLAETPGFAWLQQRSMASYAKQLGFTVLMPTSPKAKGGYYWPTSLPAQKEHEAGVLADIRRQRAALEKKLGHGFDETFVVGFSSGAYYGSSVAVRGLLDVQGYIVLAGGASPGRHVASASKRVPIFVGVSAKDRQTANDSRTFARSLAAMGWPYRAEERDAGHLVDGALLAHGMSWLRARSVSSL